jgi:hypothetical protein
MESPAPSQWLFYDNPVDFRMQKPKEGLRHLKSRLIDSTVVGAGIKMCALHYLWQYALVSKPRFAVGAYYGRRQAKEVQFVYVSKL